MSAKTSGRQLRAKLVIQMDNHSAAAIYRVLREHHANPSPAFSRVLECLEQSTTRNPDHLCTVTIEGSKAASIFATGLAILNRE